MYPLYGGDEDGFYGFWAFFFGTFHCAHIPTDNVTMHVFGLSDYYHISWTTFSTATH